MHTTHSNTQYKNESSTVKWALSKTADQIEMLFGLWAWIPQGIMY